MAKQNLNMVLFPLGLVVAWFGRFVLGDAYALMATVVAGILIGVVNVVSEERQRFLLATVSLAVLGIAAFQTLPIVGTFIGEGIKGIVALFASAAGVVALVEGITVAYKR